ncbi:hypothetical protein [Cupriavidus sp. TMH.W2]|uniref:hypothetical protein n=1 Tax=Cupriavidus sp. TMH.W2 TaxID=3434465 RepID=UPI003D782E24
MKNIWPRPRLEGGFFSDIEPIRDGDQFAPQGAIPTAVLHQTSQNYMPPDVCLEARGVRGQAYLPGDAFPAAYVEFDVLEKKPDSSIDDQRFFEACDAVNGTLSSLADAILQASVEEIGSVLALGPILHLSRLEVRSDHAGQGLGVGLGTAMLRLLSQRYRAAMLVLKPFPLQFESCAPSPEAPDHVDFTEAFNLAEKRLAEFYCDSFGVRRVREGDTFMLAPLGSLELVVDEIGWSLHKIG